jgi:hypothetical protein
MYSVQHIHIYASTSMSNSAVQSIHTYTIIVHCMQQTCCNGCIASSINSTANSTGRQQLQWYKLVIALPKENISTTSYNNSCIPVSVVLQVQHDVSVLSLVDALLLYVMLSQPSACHSA